MSLAPYPFFSDATFAPMQLDGKGSDAAILQGDIAACGTDASPSYVHIVDTVLLPFLPSMTGEVKKTRKPTPWPILYDGRNELI